MRLWTVKQIVVDSDILWEEGLGSHLQFSKMPIYKLSRLQVSRQQCLFKWVIWDLEYYVCTEITLHGEVKFQGKLTKSYPTCRVIIKCGLLSKTLQSLAVLSTS